MLFYVLRHNDETMLTAYDISVFFAVVLQCAQLPEVVIHRKIRALPGNGSSIINNGADIEERTSGIASLQ